jgi:nucleoside-diphosphate-sugar epimerase
MATNRYLVFGGTTGWIGQKMVALLAEQSIDAVCSTSRLEDQAALVAELDAVAPTHVMNCAGLTGRPNVDWCESHKADVVRVNVTGTLSLLDLCCARGIHVTNFATGCIYEYDEAHPIGGAGFTEEDPANFDGSWYSLTKAMVETMSASFDGVCTLRLRMPVSDDLFHRNFVTKITKYAKVVNVPNSMTILADMLPLAILAAQKRLSGVYNFTNPGAISHNEVLDLYTKHVDPTFRYENFTIAEQDLILSARRSNNTLDVTKLQTALGIVIPEIHDAFDACFRRMKANGVVPTTRDT